MKFTLNNNKTKLIHFVVLFSLFLAFTHRKNCVIDQKIAYLALFMIHIYLFKQKKLISDIKHSDKNKYYL